MSFFEKIKKYFQVDEEENNKIIDDDHDENKDSGNIMPRIKS